MGRFWKVCASPIFRRSAAAGLRLRWPKGAALLPVPRGERGVVPCWGIDFLGMTGKKEADNFAGMCSLPV